jgi:hypothetical protein
MHVLIGKHPDFPVFFIQSTKCFPVQCTVSVAGFKFHH